MAHENDLREIKVQITRIILRHSKSMCLVSTKTCCNLNNRKHKRTKFENDSNWSDTPRKSNKSI